MEKTNTKDSVKMIGHVIVGSGTAILVGSAAGMVLTRAKPLAQILGIVAAGPLGLVVARKSMAATDDLIDTVWGSVKIQRPESDEVTEV